MPKNELPRNESRWNQIRRLIIPNWLWQLTWLRHLPKYHRSVLWAECNRSRWQVFLDLLYIFFKLKSVPEHYSTSRLWERPKTEWPLYYGSPYTPCQRARIARQIYPFDYQILFNDKVVGAQLCKDLSIRQPLIFGSVEPDGPYREHLERLSKSSGKRRLMLKPVFGRSGMGIVLLERGDDDRVHVRTPHATIPLAEFQLDCPVFVQELVEQDPRIAAIWNSSVNTVRVITLQTLHGEVIILACGLRFGVGQSYVDNWSAGGVAVGVDIPTGRSRKYAYDQNGKRYTQHPSSGFTFEGFEIPEWQAMLDAARTVQRQLPFSKMLGLDICLDHEAKPVLIEINGLPDFVFVEQLNGPLLANPQILKAFAEYDLLFSNAQRKLLLATGTR